MNKRRLHPLEVSDASEVLHLKLWEGTAFDYSLNNHPGTLKGTAAYKYPGVDLDGNSDYIEVADHVDFSPGNGIADSGTPFSISMWVYMHSATYFVWASKWDVGANQEWCMFTGTQKRIHIRMYDDSENAYVGRRYNTSLASYENQWTHFIVTYDGGTLSSGIKIYLNGNRVDDTDSESNPGLFVAVENLNHDVWIGRYSDKYSNGLIDDVMIFNVKKSAAEIKSIYEVTRQRYGV